MTAGIRRSTYVAEAVHENAAGSVISNGELVFEMFGPLTIPESRRRAPLAHLNALGIHSREDVIRLRDSVSAMRRPRAQPLKLNSPMFLEKYRTDRFERALLQMTFLPDATRQSP